MTEMRCNVSKTTTVKNTDAENMQTKLKTITLKIRSRTRVQNYSSMAPTRHSPNPPKGDTTSTLDDAKEFASPP